MGTQWYLPGRLWRNQIIPFFRWQKGISILEFLWEWVHCIKFSVTFHLSIDVLRKRNLLREFYTKHWCVTHRLLHKTKIWSEIEQGLRLARGLRKTARCWSGGAWVGFWSELRNLWNRIVIWDNPPFPGQLTRMVETLISRGVGKCPEIAKRRISQQDGWLTTRNVWKNNQIAKLLSECRQTMISSQLESSFSTSQFHECSSGFARPAL